MKQVVDGLHQARNQTRGRYSNQIVGHDTAALRAGNGQNPYTTATKHRRTVEQLQSYISEQPVVMQSSIVNSVFAPIVITV